MHSDGGRFNDADLNYHLPAMAHLATYQTAGQNALNPIQRMMPLPSYQTTGQNLFNQAQQMTLVPIYHPAGQNTFIPIQGIVPLPAHQPARQNAYIPLQHVPERVPVAPSMLFTYANMRGSNRHYFDPLHHALYPAANRQLFTHRVWLPPIARKASFEGLPQGATFFWDSITCANLQPHRPLPPALHGGSYQPRRDQQSQVTYNEYIRQNPQAYGKNHYKGDMVWANFGYYLAEGKWVDPESEEELFAAYMNPPSSQMVEPNLLDLPRRRDHGPCILTPQEQDQFYQEFVEDVTDEHDSEGDPRAWRITPETFAQWAAGAAAGDQYEETLMKTLASLDKLIRCIC